MPSVPHRKAIRAFRRDGWSIVGQRGSHIKLAKRIRGETETIIVPRHDPIRKGTLRRILRDAELTVEQFVDLL